MGQTFSTTVPGGGHVCMRCRMLDFRITPKIRNAIAQSKTDKVSIYLGNPDKWSDSCRVCGILRIVAHLDVPLYGRVGYDSEGDTWYLCPGVVSRAVVPAVNAGPDLIGWDIRPRLPAPSRFYVNHSANWLCPVRRGDSRQGARILKPFADLALVKDWLSECASNHESCGRIKAQGLTRYSFEDGHFHIRAIDCFERVICPLPSNEPYLTLSYCWGKPTPEDNATGCQLPRNLPKLINDAIKATLELGFRYLWVDRYCIDQRSAEDKRRNIIIMDAIYATSIATIVAVACKDPSFGLPGITPRALAQILHCRKSQWAVIPPGRNVINASVWATRGWTYQEATLSAGLIYFMDEQVYFECRQSVLSESVSFQGPTANSDSVKLPTFFPSSDGNRPYRHIKRYSSRDMTVPGDILNGIQGVFNYCHSLEPALYFISGVPVMMTKGLKQPFHLNKSVQYFAQSLCWRSTSVPKRRREGFPTWSWAGWYGSALNSDNSSNWSQSSDVLNIQIEICELGVYQGPSWTPLDVYLDKQVNNQGCCSIADLIRIESIVIPDICIETDEEGLGWNARVQVGDHRSLLLNFNPSEAEDERIRRKSASREFSGGSFHGMILDITQEGSGYYSFTLLMFEKEPSEKAERVGIATSMVYRSYELSEDELEIWLAQTLSRRKVILC